MDYDSSNKFLASLAKFLQSLCNGYVDFNNGVQVIGHIYLSVDTDRTIDYVLNEKVSKTNENSVTFISNSFHAAPAEKPKQPVKNKNRGEIEEAENVTSEAGLDSTNSLRNALFSRSKRPHSPSSGTQSKLKKAKFSNTKLKKMGADTALTHSVEDSSDLKLSLNENNQVSFFDDREETEDLEKRDEKPSVETDITFIKEEYASSNSAMSGQDHDRGGEDYSSFSSFSNQPYVQENYSGEQKFDMADQRSVFNPAGESSDTSFRGIQSQFEGGDIPGDQSGSGQDHKSLDLIVTQKGNRCILYNNYRYRRDRNCKKGISWRCSTYYCKAKCITDTDITTVIQTSPFKHDHVPLTEKEQLLCKMGLTVPTNYSVFSPVESTDWDSNVTGTEGAGPGDT